MVIDCTDEVALQMAALAANASMPAGMGYIHFKSESKWTGKDFEVHHNTISLDYVEGRMVKFHARKTEDGKWNFNDFLSLDYQSWLNHYPDWESLHKAAVESLGANS